MGRKKKQVNTLQLYNLVSQGLTQREIATELGISHVTLAKRIAELQADKLGSVGQIASKSSAVATVKVVKQTSLSTQPPAAFDTV